jgi:hypothetical protein
VLSLPVSDQTPRNDTRHAELFAWADRRQPERVDWPARFSTDGGQLSLQIETDGGRRGRRMGLLLGPGKPGRSCRTGHRERGQWPGAGSQKLSTFMTGTPDSLPFVLVDTANERAWQLSAEPGELASLGELARARPAGCWRSCWPWPAACCSI